MGYMGLNHWIASDMAADARGNMLAHMVKSLEDSLKDKGNRHNTPGCVNVALILEDKTIFGKMEEYDLSYFAVVAAKAKKQLKDKIRFLEDGIKKDPDIAPISLINAKWHVKNFKRMVKSLERFKEVE